MRAKRGKGGTGRSRSTSCEDCSRRLQRRMLVGYVFADVALHLTSRARSSAKLLEAERNHRDDCRGFRDLPMYCDSVDVVPENFFSPIQDTREKQFFSKNF